MMTLITIGASISQICTLLALWQLKEWRLDRLKEHVLREGLWKTLYGTFRPALLLSFFLIGWTLPEWQLWLLTTLCILNLAQILLKRQRYPDWTAKAILAFLVTLLLTAALSLLPTPYSPTSAFIPYLQPIIIVVSWIILLPIDTFLKKRILNRARQLRNQHPDITVIGITGSVGKTTTKQLLHHILTKHNVATTPAYVNAEIGVARWLIQTLQQPSPPSIIICEMGAYRKGEIALLCSIAKPNIGIITYIGTQHMALFGSQDALRDAKAEMITTLPSDGYALLNADSDLCASCKNRAPCTTILVGTGGYADIEAFNIEETMNGIRFTVQNTTVDIPLHGTQNVTNALLAIAAAQKLDLDLPTIAKRLASFTPPEHTFSVRTQGNCTVLDDTHNASPESFKAALAWARSQPASQKILLSAGLIELGTEQERICNELGQLAMQTCDRTIFTTAKLAEPFTASVPDREVYSRELPSLEPDTLLLCIGRIPQSYISHLTGT